MFHYLLPLIIAFPKGYDVCVLIPLYQIVDRLISEEKEEILITCNLINDGKVLVKKEKTIILSKSAIKNKTENFMFNEISDINHPSYLEFEIISKKKNSYLKITMVCHSILYFLQKIKKHFCQIMHLKQVHQT